MHHQGLLQLFCLAIIVVLQPVTGITCYTCSNDPSDGVLFEADCGRYSYQGTTKEYHYVDGMCGIYLYKDGHVERTSGSGSYDGECWDFEDSKACWCSGDNCNTNSFCRHCFPVSEPWNKTKNKEETSTQTTEAATDLSSIELSTIRSTNASSIGLSTIKSTNASTTESTNHLQCYNCINCSFVDDKTPVIGDKEFKTCETRLNLATSHVIRSGATLDYLDGRCLNDGQFLTCWCKTDLCNKEKLR